MNETFWSKRVAPRQLDLFRIVFFGLLGFNSWLQIAHAPRYGATDFNVAHFDFLQWLPNPNRALLLVTFVAIAYLTFRVALGCFSKWVFVSITILYGYSYFCSQLNSFQHEYFICWLLLLFCFLPWSTRSPRESTAAKLVLIQVSFLYFWTSFSKLDPQWLSGTTLASQIKNGWAFDFAQLFGETTSQSPGGFAVLAKVIIAVELFLALGLLWKRSRTAALVVGVLFHIFIELLGFQIGLFSYFMLALYVLLAPSRWFERSNFLCGTRSAFVIWTKKNVFFFALIWLTSLGLVFAPFEENAVLVVLLGVFGTLLLFSENPIVSFSKHSGVVIVLVLLALFSTTTTSYFRFMAGSNHRLGRPNVAEMAYKTVLDRAPGYWPAYKQLAQILAVKDTEKSLQFLSVVFARDPKNKKVLKGLRQLYEQLGQVDQLETLSKYEQFSHRQAR